MTDSDQDRSRREPLKIELSVVVKTGDAPEDRITLMDKRELRMVSNVFAYRDRILRYAAGMVWRVAANSPAFYREIAPGLVQYLESLRRGRKS